MGDHHGAPGAHDRPLLVGIAGGSGAGKTTVVDAIALRLGPDQVSVIQHDAYYRDRSAVSPAERPQLNYDHPDALDTALLVEHVRALAHGQAIRTPVYDFNSHPRTAEPLHVEPHPILVVEGILILADDPLRQQLDLRVFVDTDADVRIIRRLERDIGERGRTYDSVIRQYLDSVRPMHFAFVEPSKAHADVIIDGTGSNEAAINSLIERIVNASRSHGPDG